MVMPTGQYLLSLDRLVKIFTVFGCVNNCPCKNLVILGPSSTYHNKIIYIPNLDEPHNILQGSWKSPLKTKTVELIFNVFAFSFCKHI